MVHTRSSGSGEELLALPNSQCATKAKINKKKITVTIEATAPNNESHAPPVPLTMEQVILADRNGILDAGQRPTEEYMFLTEDFRRRLDQMDEEQVSTHGLSMAYRRSMSLESIGAMEFAIEEYAAERAHRARSARQAILRKKNKGKRLARLDVVVTEVDAKKKIMLDEDGNVKEDDDKAISIWRFESSQRPLRWDGLTVTTASESRAPFSETSSIPYPTESFTRLPAEIRLMIYKLCLPQFGLCVLSTVRVSTLLYHNRVPSIFNLLLVDKLIAMEARQVFYDNAKFCIKMYSGARGFEKMMKPRRRSSRNQEVYFEEDLLQAAIGLFRNIDISPESPYDSVARWRESANITLSPRSRAQHLRKLLKKRDDYAKMRITLVMYSDDFDTLPQMANANPNLSMVTGPRPVWVKDLDGFRILDGYSEDFAVESPWIVQIKVRRQLSRALESDLQRLEYIRTQLRMWIAELGLSADHQVEIVREGYWGE